MSTGKKIILHIVAFLVILFVCQCCFGDEGMAAALCFYLGGICVYYFCKGILYVCKETANYIRSHQWIKFLCIFTVLLGVNLFIDLSLESDGFLLFLLCFIELIIYILYSIIKYFRKKKQARIQKELDERARQLREKETKRRAQQTEESLRRKVAELERQNESLRRQQSSSFSSSGSSGNQHSADVSSHWADDADRRMRERDEREYQKFLREWEEFPIEITVTYDCWFPEYNGSYEGEWVRGIESTFYVPRNQVASYIQGGASAMLNGVGSCSSPSNCRNVRWEISPRYYDPRPERLF